jgi:hypothetical protein
MSGGATVGAHRSGRTWPTWHKARWRAVEIGAMEVGVLTSDLMGAERRWLALMMVSFCSTSKRSTVASSGRMPSEKPSGHYLGLICDEFV